MAPAAWRRSAFCCVLLAVVLQVHGQPSEDAVRRMHPLVNLPPRGEVSTKYVLPEHPQKLFPAGEVVPILLGFRNEATFPYNITAITGSLNSVANFSVNIQNFGTMAVGVIIPPALEVTLEYKFRPDPALTPVEFNVAVAVFYSDSSGQREHSSVFFNDTIDIVEPEKFFDTEVLFMYATIICLIALAVFGMVRWVANLSVFRKVTTSKKSKKPLTATAEDEWLKGTPVGGMLASDKRKNKGKKEAEKKTE